LSGSCGHCVPRRFPTPDSTSEASPLPIRGLSRIRISPLSIGTMRMLRLPRRRRADLVWLDRRFLSKTAVSLAVTGSRGDAPGHLFSRSSVPAYFSTASSGISRVPAEPFAGMPCSQIPAEPPRLAIAASWCCPPLPRNRWTSALRSFRDSIARPSCSLFTLRADVAADYAKLASRLMASLCRSAPSMRQGSSSQFRCSSAPPSTTGFSRRDQV
jgi:hypothetical protein